MATAQFDRPVEQWFDGEYSAIPERMQEALRRYVFDRIQPGDFLTAVICNNLRNAVNYADEDNLQLLRLYVRWFYNVAPAPCYGSLARMNEWLERS